MRMYLQLLCLFATVCLVGTATADKPADDKQGDGTPDKPAKPKSEIDVSAIRKDLIVLHDGRGHFIIVLPKGGVKENHLYYGDGKVFHRQATYGSGRSPGRIDYSFWAPRARPGNSGQVKGYLRMRKGKWAVQCSKRETPLEQLRKQDADKLLASAVFKHRYWKRQAYALARDDRGVYYYVDRMLARYGGKGFRLFVGPRGSMTQRPMTNIVSDSEGDIFATKSGELRLILSRKDATWVKGKERTPLKYVPPRRNVVMIYNDLGVYRGFLGTPCDDL